MNVKRDLRGNGIGRRLLDIGIAWARNRPSIEKLILVVTSNNAHAIGLYTKCGFSIEGTEIRAIKRNGQYYDFIHMGLFVK